MGTEGVWLICAGDLKNMASTHLVQHNGKRLDVDASGVLYRIAHGKSTSEMCVFVQCKPQCRLEHTWRATKRQLTVLKKHFSEAIYVLDGARHPMKNVTRKGRDKKISDALEIKEALESTKIKEANDDHRKKHVKCMMELIHPDACMTKT